MYFSGVNTAKGEKDDELLTTMVCQCSWGVQLNSAHEAPMI